MATITTRVQGDSPKGSPLTNAEVDNNFINLNTAKYESGDNVSLGSATFSGDVTLGEATPFLRLQESGAGQKRLDLSVNSSAEAKIEANQSASTMIFNVSSTEYLRFKHNSDGIIFNEGSANRDFRVESDGNTHALYVDSDTSLVYIKGNSGQQATRDADGNRETNLTQFHVNNLLSVGAYSFLGQGHNNTGNLAFNMTPDQSGNYWPQWAEQASAGGAIIRMPSGGNGGLEIYTKRFGQDYSSFTLSTASKALYIPDTGGVILNDDSRSVDFRVESNDNGAMLFVDGADNRVGVGTSDPKHPLHVAGAVSVDGAVHKAHYLSVPTSSTRYLKVDITGSYGLYEIMATGYGSSGSANFFAHWTDGGHGGGNTYHRVHLISKNAQSNNPTLGELKKTSAGAYLAITNNSATNSISCHIIVRAYNSSGSAATVSLETTEPTAVQTINSLVVDEPNERLYIGRGDAQNNAKVNIKSNAAGQALSLQVQNDAYSLIQGWNSAGALRFQVTGAGTITNKQGGAIFNDDSTAYDFRVESDSNGNMLFVDGGENRVGVGLGVPGSVLDVNGVSSNRVGSYGAYNTGLLEITNSATPSQIKITTNIKWSGSGASTHAHTVTIRGFQYGSARTADLQISWHKYAGSFYNRTMSSSGGWAPTVTLAVENNYVVIHLADPGYWPKMYVESMYNAYGGPNQAMGWSWSDAAISPDNDTPSETVPYTSNFGNGNTISGGVVFNEFSDNGQDFRVESDNYANMLKVDASEDAVLMNNPDFTSDVLNLGGQSKIRFGGSNYGARIGYWDDTSGDHGFHIDTLHGGTFDSRVFTVQSQYNRVGILTDTPSYPLHVNGTSYFSGQVRTDDTLVSYTDSGTKQYIHLATGSLYGQSGCVRIKTNIPGHNISGNGNMFSFRIIGYSYSGYGNIDMQVGMYCGENNFYSYIYSGIGDPQWVDKVWVYTDSNGKVVVQLGTTNQTQNCEIAITDFVQGFGNVNTNYAKGWTITAQTSAETENNKHQIRYLNRHLGGLTLYGTENSVHASSGMYGGLVFDGPAYREYQYYWNGTSSHTTTLTCGSYQMSEIIYTAHQTNSGSDNNEYWRGKWSNNHTSHIWSEMEHVGNIAAMTTSISATHNGGNTYNGKLTISETYNSGSYSRSTLTIRNYYGDFDISHS